MFAIIAMIIAGVVKIKVLGYHPVEPKFVTAALEPLTIFLLLRAFSSGCAALTGIEAVSNAVPNFQDPAPKRARKVLMFLSLIILTLFGGVSYLANLYHVIPAADNSVLSQISGQIFGQGFMYYFIQITTMIILAMAANTAYAGFPMLISIMARDGFAPKQLSHRGERLSYSNGITILTIIAGILIVIFKADVSSLIPLYAIGVFISFTLSQSGMFLRWIRSREKGWIYKACVNGFGALTTLITVIVIATTKFLAGAWIVILIIPLIMLVFFTIKRHYAAVATQLRYSLLKSLEPAGPVA